ncbi:MAG: glycosyltransferase family A protein [Microbacterium sp.]
MEIPPRVAVVMRTKDRPGFIGRALEDVLAQTFGEWEIVVANDGGDRAAVDAAIAPFEQRMAGRLRVIDVPRPGGRCAAANDGIRASSAPFVVLHDDDDFWAPGFLATTVAWLEANPQASGVAVPTEIVYQVGRDGQWVESGRAPFWAGMQQITYTDLLSINRIVPISLLYRRAVHDEVGFYDESLEAVEDWEFYLRVTVDGTIGFLPGAPLAFWTQRPAATGAEGNSMFALGSIHERDDRLVRDRALRAYVREHGPGLPLFIAGELERAKAELEREIRVHNPVWSRLRGWARSRRSGG